MDSGPPGLCTTAARIVFIEVAAIFPTGKRGEAEAESEGEIEEYKTGDRNLACCFSNRIS